MIYIIILYTSISVYNPFYKSKSYYKTHFSLDKYLIEKAKKTTEINAIKKIVPGKKSGYVLSTKKIRSFCPEIYDLYTSENFRKQLSNIVGKQLYPFCKYEFNCSIIHYKDKGDFITWHYDTNVTNGSIYNVLIPIENTSTCAKLKFMNENNTEEIVELKTNEMFIFEADKIFHAVDRLCDNESRIIISRII